MSRTGGELCYDVGMMVQTVETIDDFLRILRERPDIRDAVRREILTEELMALPGVVAGIAKTQAEHTRMLAEHSAAIARISDTQAEHTRILTEHTEAIRNLQDSVSRLDGSVSRLDGSVSRLDGSVSRLDGRVSRLDGRVSGLDGRVGTLEGTVNRLDGRVGNLSGMVAMLLVERYYGIIAIEMDLDPVRMLDPVEIFRMSRSETLKRKYDEDARKSFGQCDLMIEAIGPDDGECYIAVQVSYTVDHRDIQRAIDHAEMMTCVTGKPAYAAVAGAERAGVTESRIESGSVHWHRLREGMFKSR